MQNANLSYSTSKIDGLVKLHMREDGLGAKQPETMHDALSRMAKTYPNYVALVSCEDKEYTYGEYYSLCRKFAKSLLHFGLKKFEGVDIIGFNHPFYAIAYMGAIFAGGISTGIYATNTPLACKYCAETSNCAVVVVDGETQLAKYIEIQNEFKPKVVVIYNHGNKTLPTASFPIYTIEQFLEIGDDITENILDETINVQKPNQCCTMIFTSGTTGDPKSVLISHDNCTWTGKTALFTVLSLHSDEDYTELEQRITQLRIVSYLPLSHIAAQIVDFFLQLIFPVKIYYAKPDALKGSLLQTLQKSLPHIHLGVPRVWEKMRDSLTSKLGAIGGIKGMLISWARWKSEINTGNLQTGAIQQWNLGYGLAKWLCLDTIKTQLGFTELIAAVSSAAPLSSDVIKFFGTVNIPIYEIFGQSEGSGPITSNNYQNWKIGAAGIACRGVEMKTLPDNQEICYAGRNVFMGYLNREEETKETIDEEGFVHTGDMGFIDEDGFLFITGRLKEIIITAGGENISPVVIEDNLKTLMPFLSNVVVIGDQKKFLSALFTLKSTSDNDGNPLDVPSTETMAILTQIGSKARVISEAKHCPVLREYVNSKVNIYNTKFSISRAQNIQKWLILERDFALGTGELTPTLKLKRNVVTTKWATTIDSFYE